MSIQVSSLSLVSKIGNGHFGEVFLGKDDVRGDVAVKVLSRLPGELDLQWQARRDGLLREAQNLAKAKHRNVVDVHYCVESDDGESIRFCMQLCPKGSLQAAFDAGPMPLSSVRKIATEVLLGLQALHLRGMLHRDIKPANILLDEHNVALLGDFGLVTDDLLLGYGSAAGYRDHLAYEVWQGNPTSVKTDVWALGMTIFRLLHGKIWYEEQVAPRYVIGAGGFRETLRWLPHVPPRWRRVIRQMMNDDPTQRFQNCEQLLQAFATLPIPAWECVVDHDHVRWRRQSGKRIHSVGWSRKEPRRNEWVAYNEPVGSGRRLQLGGSSHPRPSKMCAAELDRFFTTS